MVPLRTPPLGRVRDAALTRLEYARRAGRGSAERRVVAILGMHRSGTSAVAGTLQQAGLYLGNVLRRHESNRRGTRENLEIVDLHDAILAHSGGSWRDPPPRIEWADEHRARRDRVVASFAGAELWGFKDPRTILLLDFWREALGDSLAFVGVFREPSAVVSSLLDRDGGTPAEWFALWAYYNERLLSEHETAAFPLVEFVSDVESFHKQVIPVLHALDLRESVKLDFFESRLAGSLKTSSSVPPNARVLYERLCAVRT